MLSSCLKHYQNIRSRCPEQCLRLGPDDINVYIGVTDRTDHPKPQVGKVIIGIIIIHIIINVFLGVTDRTNKPKPQGRDFR